MFLRCPGNALGFPWRSWHKWLGTGKPGLPYLGCYTRNPTPDKQKEWMGGSKLCNYWPSLTTCSVGNFFLRGFGMESLIGASVIQSDRCTDHWFSTHSRSPSMATCDIWICLFPPSYSKFLNKGVSHHKLKSINCWTEISVSHFWQGSAAAT